ncbi:uncharacterized protein BDW70DRAFT_130428 [Aspergillus foveolatus]|uniref:uncharacterized protein n=1 Tax=Aspergillus foveolatus TaxID=210207 RepID=UPI003CCE4E89
MAQYILCCGALYTRAMRRAYPEARLIYTKGSAYCSNALSIWLLVLVTGPRRFIGTRLRYGTLK